MIYVAIRILTRLLMSSHSNHPLAHLMQSVFGIHDRNKFTVYLYATSPSDDSSFRRKIEAESDKFIDVSTWSINSIVNRIVQDQIHIRSCHSQRIVSNAPNSHYQSSTLVVTQKELEMKYSQYGRALFRSRLWASRELWPLVIPISYQS